MPDAWRAYLEMALGLTETPRKRAQKAVGDLVNRGGATAAQLQGLVEDLMQAGMANREALTNIVRFEVDRALGVVGLATADEVTELTTRVRELEKQLEEARSHAVRDDGAPEAETGGSRLERPAPLPRKKAVAKKAVPATPNAMPVAAKAVAKKTVAKKAVKKAAPEPLTTPIAEALPPADAAALAEVADTPAPAKKAVAKRAPAKKTAPVKKSAPAEKATPSSEPEN